MENYTHIANKNTHKVINIQKWHILAKNELPTELSTLSTSTIRQIITVDNFKKKTYVLFTIYKKDFVFLNQNYML